MSSADDSTSDEEPRRKVRKKRSWRAPFHTLTADAARKRLYREKKRFEKELGYVASLPQQQHPASDSESECEFGEAGESESEFEAGEAAVGSEFEWETNDGSGVDDEHYYSEFHASW